MHLRYLDVKSRVLGDGLNMGIEGERHAQGGFLGFQLELDVCYVCGGWELWLGGRKKNHIGLD